MEKNIVSLFLVALSMCAITRKASGQVSERKAEVGGVFTSITLDNFKASTPPGIGSGDSTMRGLGGRVAYNFTNYLALDTEVSFFPETHFGNEEFGQKMQGFIGVKAGTRNKWAGVFAKARPGVMWFGEFSSRGSCSSSTFVTFCGVAHEKDFAMDLGGVVEVYPSERAIIRADVGDTIIRFPQRTFGSFNNPSIIRAETKHNLQVSVGFGWRF